MGLTDFYEHGIARGIVRFARGRSDWDLYGFGWMFQHMGSLEGWEGDGLIARIESGRDADRLAARGLPLVDVAGAWPRPGFNQVCNDDAATGRLAGRHLRALGFPRFAFCGVTRVGWSRARREGFRQAVGAGTAGLPVFEESLPWWEHVHRSERLESWLAALRTPVALFACNDTAGLKLAAACRSVGLAVPRDVAILGVDNEDILCELCVPPLSSVMLDCERIGFNAAEHLAALLDAGVAHGVTRPASRGSRRAGKEPRRAGDTSRRGAPRTPRGSIASRDQPVRIAPREVVERASTRIVASADPLVERALTVIRSEATGGLTVTALMKATPSSRRGLETRFRAALGRSIHDEIVRVRIEKARELLRGTTLTIAAVADESGYGNAQRFHEAFKRSSGMTPGAYRKSYRGS